MHLLAAHQTVCGRQRWARSARPKPFSSGLPRATTRRTPVTALAASSSAASLSPPREPSSSWLPFNFPTFLGAASSVGALLLHLGYLPQVPATYLVYFLGASVFSFLWGTISTQAALNHDRKQYKVASATAEEKYAQLVSALQQEIVKIKQEAEKKLASNQEQLKTAEGTHQLQLKEAQVSMEAALQQAEADKKSAAANMAATEARISVATESVSKLSAQLDASQAKVQTLEADLGSTRAKLAEAEQQAGLAAQLGKELQEQKVVLEGVQASLASAQQDKATADSLVEQLQRSLNSATEQVSLLQSKLGEETAKASAALEAQASSERSAAELRSSLEESSSELSALKMQAAASEKAVAELQAKVSQLQASKDAAVAAVQKDLDDLRSANQNASVIAARSSSLEERLQELEKQRLNDQQEITMLRRFADETATESRTLKKQNNSKNDEITELRRQLVMVNPGRLFENFKAFGVNTFWSSLVEDYLMKPLERGGKLANAAIVGADTGVWGADANFPQVTRQEVQDIASAFSNNSTAVLTSKGIWLAKRKYDFSSMKNGVLHGRTWGGGCCITASANTLVVGIWSDPLNVKPDDVEAQLLTVRDYLESVGC